MNARLVGIMIALLICVEAAAFGAAALLHAGVPLPFGIAEPATLNTAVAESLVSALLVICAVAILTRRYWARRVAFLAHGVAVASIMMGMANLALSQTDRSVANDYFYRVMLLLSLLMLVFLLTPTAGAALTGNRKPAPGASPAASARP